MVRIPLFEGKQSNQFLVLVGSQWVLETRFSPEKRMFTSQEYSMKVLHQFKDLPGVASFQGVVRDSHGIIVGYLNELPSRGRLHNVMAGAHVSRTRREEWCKQIIETVAVFHHNLRMVGMLGVQEHPPIGIDHNDRAVLLSHFRETLPHEPGYVGALPPECRPYRKSARASAATDLYHLGFVRWRIAGNRMGGARSAFCRAAACTTPPNVICQEPHTDPIQLSMPADDYSDHLRRIISACRTQDPCERLPAHELLAMFPRINSHKDGNSNTRESHRQHHIRPEELQELYSGSTTCDKCGQLCYKHLFNCSLCLGGDFDLCHACFLRGIHCSDTKHYLRECHWRNKEDNLYSCVQESGKREIKTFDELDIGLI